MASIAYQIGTVLGKNIHIFVANSLESYKEFGTDDESWVEDGNMTSQVFYKEPNLMCVIKLGTGLTEDEVGKLLETICAGFWMDIKKVCGNMSTGKYVFAGKASAIIVDLLKENNMV